MNQTPTASPPASAQSIRIAPERLSFLQDAVATGAALSAAEKLGVLARLDRGPATPAEVAADCAISQRGAELLLAALAGLGLLEAGAGGAYTATLPGLVRIGALRAPWDHLTTAIQLDRPAVSGDTLSGAAAYYPKATPFLGAVMTPVAHKAAEIIVQGRAGLRVLDIGAGAATWSLPIAARDSASRITALDVAEVLPVTQRSVAAVGLQDRFEYVGGDLFSIDLTPSTYDVVIAGNVCHLFDVDTNRRLLRRAYEALKPGGQLAILDAVPTDQMDGPRQVVLYALGLLWRTSHGRVYPFSTYNAWLQEIGFTTTERVDLAADPAVSLILAARA